MTEQQKQEMSHPLFINYTGKKIGLVTITAYVGRDPDRGTIWEALCACGQTRIVNKGQFGRLIQTKKCKCKAKAERVIKSKLTWSGQHRRCRICDAQLARNRYFHCEGCRNQLGDEVVTYNIYIK